MKTVIAAQALATSNMPLVVFVLYTLLLFLIAFFAHRMLAKRSFLGEYYLGSRSLGMIALALTFGATSASAGSFAGFPALIYTHGWILALWIASYMIFPLCGLGLLGKRLNQVARKAGAITLPDVLEARFKSPALALISTFLIANLLTVYLIPQFKLAALIVEQLLGSGPLLQQGANWLVRISSGELPGGESPEYILCLVLFAGLVIIYTTLGGFRAVVWTDILQGFVMIVGVLFMLILVLSRTGGLSKATSELANLTPPEIGEVVFYTPGPAPPFGYHIPADTWFVVEDASAGGERLLRTNEAAHIPTGLTNSESTVAVEITTPAEVDKIREQFRDNVVPPLPPPVKVRIERMRSYAYGAGQRGVFVSGPGPSPTNPSGFLPLGLAFSFFVFWAFSGTGQPGNMIRLMAFDSSQTLRRAIMALAIYFTLIYIPLVIIFTSARLIVPGLDQTPDRIMPVLAYTLSAGANMPWLAGLLIAAPFAAAMSTVDSFILMISSSIVRDIYQRHINPDADERTIKRMSYLVTLVIGMVAFIGALNPPQFLQYLIVFTGGGLAAAFLIPVTLALYWRRFNRQAAIASMLAGISSYMFFYALGYAMYSTPAPYLLMGLDPLLWSFGISLLIAFVVTYTTPPPDKEIIHKFFHV